MAIFETLLNHNRTSLIEENDDGNIEYKWRLDLKNDISIKKLVSQLLWRLNEGKDLTGIYEAHYVLGVYDNGDLGKLSKEDLDITIDVFKQVVMKASAEIIYEENNLILDSNVYYCIVRLKPSDKKLNEINVMFCGPEQMGKTTLLSHLCHSNLDDGNGSIREYIMNHEHEKISGNTTSIKKQIIGVRNYKLLNYDFSHNWEEITKVSDKIINIYDTPGNKKYFKNVLNALRTFMIDIIFFIQDDTKDTKDTKDEILTFNKFIKDYCLTYNVPFYTLITKNKTKSNLIDKNILHISCTEPQLSDMDKLKDILIHSKKIELNEYNYILENMFRITNIYNIPDRNKIIEGIQTNGIINRNSKSYILYQDLSFSEIIIDSIFRKNIESNQLYSKETGSIGFLLKNSNMKEPNKNCIILDSLEKIKQLQVYEQNSILKLKIRIKGEQLNNNYYLINGNLSYYVLVQNIIDDYIYLQINNKMYLQDNIIFLYPIDFKSFSQIYLCEFFYKV